MKSNKATGFAVYETIGMSIVNQRGFGGFRIENSITIDLKLAKSVWKIKAICTYKSASLYLTFSDEVQIERNQIWRLANIDQNRVMTDLKSRVITYDMIYDLVYDHICDITDPKTGNLLPSERSLISGPNYIPDSSWEGWYDFIKQIDNTLDVLQVMDG